jgi:prevent-host-death family protein
MIQQVNIHEAKTQLSRLIELTQTGQEFIIAKAGKPVARLTPIGRGNQPRRLGLLDGQIRLPAATRQMLETPDNEIYCSAANLWEITIKSSLGRTDF